MSVQVDTSGLTRLHARPPLLRYVRQAWDRREFAAAIAAGQIRSQHMDTVLGSLWHVLNPALLVAIYYLIFGVLLDTTRGVDNFIGFLSIGVFLYGYSQRAITQGAGAIPSNLGLIRSLQFPRAILPTAAVVKETIALGPSLLVIVLVLLATGEPVGLSWLLLAPVLLLQFTFNLGAALLVARLTDQVRDVQNILPYVFRLLFYLSGVLYSVDAFVTDEAIQRLFLLDPFYVYISLPREYLLASHQHSDIALQWASAIAWAPLSLTLGIIVFRSGEHRYGRG